MFSSHLIHSILLSQNSHHNHNSFCIYVIYYYITYLVKIYMALLITHGYWFFIFNIKYLNFPMAFAALLNISTLYGILSIVKSIIFVFLIFVNFYFHYSLLLLLLLLLLLFIYTAASLFVNFSKGLVFFKFIF